MVTITEEVEIAQPELPVDPQRHRKPPFGLDAFIPRTSARKPVSPAGSQAPPGCEATSTTGLPRSRDAARLRVLAAKPRAPARSPPGLLGDFG